MLPAMCAVCVPSPIISQCNRKFQPAGTMQKQSQRKPCSSEMNWKSREKTYYCPCWRTGWKVSLLGNREFSPTTGVICGKSSGQCPQSIQRQDTMLDKLWQSISTAYPQWREVLSTFGKPCSVQISHTHRMPSSSNAVQLMAINWRWLINYLPTRQRLLIL